MPPGRYATDGWRLWRLDGEKKGKPLPKGQSGSPKKRARRRIQLMVLPEPEPNTRAVFIYTGEGAVVRGSGNVVMECGNCGVPLVEGVPVGNIQSIVFKCPNCEEFNETLA